MLIQLKNITHHTVAVLVAVLGIALLFFALPLLGVVLVGMPIYWLTTHAGNLIYEVTSLSQEASNWAGFIFVLISLSALFGLWEKWRFKRKIQKCKNI